MGVRGKSRSFVVQDKGTAVRYGIFWPFPQRTRSFFPSEAVMISQLYGTAENPAGSLPQRLHARRLEGLRGPIATMVGTAIATAVLVMVGEAFGVLISNTD